MRQQECSLTIPPLGVQLYDFVDQMHICKPSPLGLPDELRIASFACEYGIKTSGKQAR